MFNLFVVSDAKVMNGFLQACISRCLLFEMLLFRDEIAVFCDKLITSGHGRAYTKKEGRTLYILP